MVCRPHSSIGGPLLQLWLGIFFNPLPEFTPRLTTCSDEVITEDSFSPSKISSSLRCLILLLYPGAHQKLASIKWHYLHERQLPNNLSPTLPFYLQSRACTQKKKRKERTQKRRGILVRAAEASTPPSFPCFKSNYFFPASVIFLGAFQRDCTWKLVTKQHIHTFHPHEGSLKFSTPEG